MAFTSLIYWACRFWTVLELDLKYNFLLLRWSYCWNYPPESSVEWIVEYLDLPQEPPAVIESNRPLAYWPSSSNNNSLIVVEDLVIKYAPELPPVLHRVSFTLKAGEQVGLLGWTGVSLFFWKISAFKFPSRKWEIDTCHEYYAICE